MWVFKSKFRNSYLAANPKVLTQTLLLQENLERFLSKKRYVHFVQKEISKKFGPEYIMLVRNPYKRVESFFKEKLRQKVLLVLNEDDPYILKRHQKIFYPYLGIKETDSLESKVERLLRFDFKSFVNAIPDVYKIEDHIAPQTFNFTRQLFGVPKVMKMNRYVKIEDKEAMRWLGDYLTLDLSIKANNSSDVQEAVAWDHACFEIVRKIYKKDFETFSYNTDYPD